jgi:general secretion pathway protein L
MSFGQDLYDLGDWWLDELRGMIPARFKNDPTRRQAPDYKINVGKTSLQIVQLRADTIETSLQDLANSLVALTNVASAPKRPVVELILEPGRYLERRLAPFRLPKRRAHDMAAFDVQSATPLDPADAQILFAKDAGNRIDQRYFVVKKQLLVPLISAVESVSGRISAIKAHTESERVEMRCDGYRHLLRHGRGQSLVGNFLVVGMLACLVGAAFTFWHAQWRYSDAIHQLDAKIDAVDADVKIVRALSERRKLQVQQIESVQTQKRQAIPVVRIIEEMTRIIPDGSWVSDLSIKGDTVSATGISQSAGGLVGMLEASSLFTGPIFTAPVVKAPGMDGERFSIEMDVER